MANANVNDSNMWNNCFVHLPVACCEHNLPHPLAERYVGTIPLRFLSPTMALESSEVCDGCRRGPDPLSCTAQWWVARFYRGNAREAMKDWKEIPWNDHGLDVGQDCGDIEYSVAPGFRAFQNLLDREVLDGTEAGRMVCKKCGRTCFRGTALCTWKDSVVNGRIAVSSVTCSRFHDGEKSYEQIVEEARVNNN